MGIYRYLYRYPYLGTYGYPTWSLCPRFYLRCFCTSVPMCTCVLRCFSELQHLFHFYFIYPWYLEVSLVLFCILYLYFPLFLCVLCTSSCCKVLPIRYYQYPGFRYLLDIPDILEFVYLFDTLGLQVHSGCLIPFGYLGPLGTFLTFMYLWPLLQRALGLSSTRGVDKDLWYRQRLMVFTTPMVFPQLMVLNR